MESSKHPSQCRHSRTRVSTVIMRMHDVKVTVALTTYSNAHTHGSYNLGLGYGPPRKWPVIGVTLMFWIEDE
jgi:hypothetical protein